MRGEKRLKISRSFIVGLLAVLTILWGVLFCYLRNPALTFSSGSSRVEINANSLKETVLFLSGLTPDRSYHNVDSMLRAENYIQERLKKLGYEVHLQDVDSYRDQTYHNIIVRYGDVKAAQLIVIGAHYDAAGENNPGADDNASGIAGLLEIARLLQENKPPVKTGVELVFYTLEEPPFFGGHSMGSAFHADQLKENNIDVKLMISLEMIGYFSDHFLSQEFPLPLLYGFYPWTGNFIGVVGHPADRDVTKEFKQSMEDGAQVPVYSVNAPPIITGIDFSDHRSYWAHDWPALMVTDTAFYRNDQYHQSGDTPERLNYTKMADVVSGVYKALVDQARKQ